MCITRTVFYHRTRRYDCDKTQTPQLSSSVPLAMIMISDDDDGNGFFFVSPINDNDAIFDSVLAVTFHSLSRAKSIIEFFLFRNATARIQIWVMTGRRVRELSDAYGSYSRRHYGQYIYLCRSLAFTKSIMKWKLFRFDDKLVCSSRSNSSQYCAHVSWSNLLMIRITSDSASFHIVFAVHENKQMPCTAEWRAFYLIFGHVYRRYFPDIHVPVWESWISYVEQSRLISSRLEIVGGCGGNYCYQLPLTSTPFWATKLHL